MYVVPSQIDVAANSQLDVAVLFCPSSLGNGGHHLTLTFMSPEVHIHAYIAIYTW